MEYEIDKYGNFIKYDKNNFVGEDFAGTENFSKNNNLYNDLIIQNDEGIVNFHIDSFDTKTTKDLIIDVKNQNNEHYNIYLYKENNYNDYFVFKSGSYQIENINNYNFNISNFEVKNRELTKIDLKLNTIKNNNYETKDLRRVKSSENPSIFFIGLISIICLLQIINIVRKLLLN